MDTLRQDLRYAIRTLSRNSGFTAVAVVCLALGIGVNTTMFSVVNALMLRPLPYREPAQLVALYETNPKDGQFDNNWSFPDFFDMREQSSAFEGAAAHYSRFFTVTGGTEAEGVEGEVVTPTIFRILGIRPVLGRDFAAEEEQAGKEHVVLLGHGFWERRFAGDKAVVGKTLLLNGEAYTVIGVMPPRFSIDLEQIWVPMALNPGVEHRGSHYMDVIARLKPGTTIDQASKDVNAIAVGLQGLYPRTNTGTGATARSLREEMLPGEVRLVVWVMFGAVCFVLLIACANVANLLLARASSREREMAVRTALGARRFRIVRQLLTESVLIGLMGGVLGVGVAYAGLKAMIANIPLALPFWMVFDIDLKVLLFTLAVGLLTGVIFGLAPALQASRANLQASLKEGGRGSGSSAHRSRLRSGLVVAEVALSLVLLIGASLMVKSFLHMRSANTGFDSSNALTTRVYLGGDKYEAFSTRVSIFEQILERVRTVPGVTNVAAVSNIPLSGSTNNSSFQVEGQPVVLGEVPAASQRAVTATYFETMRIPLTGRSFTDREMRDSTPVIIVNKTLAARYWPGQEAIGKRLRMSTDSTRPWLTVVGIAPDIRMREITSGPESQVYLPYALVPNRTMAFIVRTNGDPTNLIGAVRAEVRAVDPTLPLIEVQTLERLVALSFWENELYGKMFGTFGIVALLLAAVGVYGVMAYAVAQRTHEIGVRMALGAQAGDVFRMVVGRGLALAAAGLAIGLVGAFAITRLLTGVLYNVEATDPVVFISIALLLAAVAAVASWAPARRATRVDPLVALRYD
ncbi:MAG: ABC transporter permease [Gemmatimonadaceae bacterium]|nr:ABC transporter permease [Gemmatimonadaceae bacterium]